MCGSLEHHYTGDFIQLGMEQLGNINAKYASLLDKNVATHVVTGIEFGGDAYLVFDREFTSTENKTDVSAASCWLVCIT